MTRYHMFMYDTGNDCIDFYSTDATLLNFLAGELATRFGAFRVENGEIGQAGEMSVFFKGLFYSRYVEHYLNQMLCGSGWEPYDEGCFKLRYEA